ncbi:Uncharacterised protein [Legionella pneumophila]|nr:Uncharacterised protein [Legionella pneumophila]
MILKCSRLLWKMSFFLINTIILAVSNGTTCDGMVLQFKIPLHLGESSILSL